MKAAVRYVSSSDLSKHKKVLTIARQGWGHSVPSSIAEAHESINVSSGVHIGICGNTSATASRTTIRSLVFNRSGAQGVTWTDFPCLCPSIIFLVCSWSCRRWNFISNCIKDHGRVTGLTPQGSKKCHKGILLCFCPYIPKSTPLPGQAFEVNVLETAHLCILKCKRQLGV